MSELEYSIRQDKLLIRSLQYKIKKLNDELNEKNIEIERMKCEMQIYKPDYMQARYANALRNLGSDYAARQTNDCFLFGLNFIG